MQCMNSNRTSALSQPDLYTLLEDHCQTFISVISFTLGLAQLAAGFVLHKPL